jgi:hypothetical protein
MKLYVLGLAGVLAAAVAGCQTTSPENATALTGEPPLAETPPPLPEVGTVTSWRTKDGAVVSDTVVDVTDGVASYENTRGWAWSQGPFWTPTVAWSGPDGEKGSQTYTGETELFPLAIGKSITMAYSGASENGAFNGQQRCTVEGAERIAVPVGEYDTYKIVCISGGNLSNPFWTRVRHYAPELGQNIRFFRKKRDGEELVRELISVTPPAAAPASS